MLDGNARQNLATFCQTWLDRETHELMDACLGKNLIDKDEYPQTAEIEARCVHMLADLWNAPAAADTLGTSTVGSSDAAMLGGMAAKWRWRERRRAEGKPTDRPNLVCGPVQVCWHKFARYWDVELREIPLEGDRLIMSPKEVLKRVDENTICVVPTFGVTFTCDYEPVQAVSDALDRLQAETGLDVPLHVDAASGGFLAPFCAPDIVWDFRLPRVRSINASGHKFGLAPLGTGWCVFRDRSDLPEDLIFRVNYLGGDMPTCRAQFLPSRRAGGRAVLQLPPARPGRLPPHPRRLLRDGALPRRRDRRDGGRSGCCSTVTPATASPPSPGPLREADAGFTLFDLSDRLRTRGWQVAAYAMPADRTDLVVQRVLVRHGFTRDLAGLFVADLKRSLAHFEGHPVARPMNQTEAGGYHH